METVTVPILESDLQKLEEITGAMNDMISPYGKTKLSQSDAAYAALREGIKIVHDAMVTK